ncbi:MAG: type IX secretion system protein PorQ [Ignavibacteriae bacterium]|nr:type IX secretion system protein PorQ [Ignavibacteriota bacterium]MCB9210314.1 type IX secretion system protein PorQ [Ignavibacteriales bacterium]MCB9219119.1 type IX secretion system protein PorQ [Ignavibacteriales bacterium]MCB9259701.1 type IX secretion system protein PorQ [Ignavibacteriales bacterium]
MKIAFKISIILFVVSSLSAQSTYNFLRLDQSPRAAALAGSFVANVDDPNVIFYNPAGISTLQENPISFSSLFYLLDINSAALSYSQEFENIGRFGAGIQYINYGSFVEANDLGTKTGEFGAGEFAAVIGYSNELDQNFYYGANAKFIFSSIADRSSMGLAVDLGLLYTIPDERWSFGFSVLNLGSQITQYYSTSEDLPLDIRLGISKTLQHLPFTFFASLNKLNEKYDKLGDRFQQFTFGGEFKMSKVVRLRFGYDNEKRKEYKIGGTGGIAGFSLGLGLLISKYNFDYAFSSLGSIGALHRIGISTEL